MATRSRTVSSWDASLIAKLSGSSVSAAWSTVSR
jgi:hypothetical protein